MPLVAAQVGQPGAQRAAPGNRTAVIAGVPGKGRVAHLGQQFVHHGGIATKTVTGQHQQVASQVLQRAVWPLVAQAGDTLVRINPKRAHGGFGEQVSTGGQGGPFQLGHQRSTCFFWHGVHAPQAVAGVQKTVQHLQRDAVPPGQLVQCRADGLGVGLNQMRRCRAMRLGLNVLGKQRRAVAADASLALHAGGRRRDEARGQRGGAAGAGVALQQQAVQAGIAQRQRGDQTAGTGTNDGHRDMRRVGGRLAQLDGGGNGHGAYLGEEVWGGVSVTLAA